MAFVSRGISRVYGIAERRVAVIEGPLAQHIRQHQAAGTDLTQAVNREFVANWSALWPYRRARFWREVALIREGGVISMATIGFVDALMIAKAATRCLACYMLGVMAVRGSVLPLMAPDSPLRPGLDFVNPNVL